MQPVLEILTNREAIAVNQAYTTNAGDRIVQNGTSEVTYADRYCVKYVKATQKISGFWFPDLKFRLQARY